ncbi:MAG: hypothetical protein Q8L29_01460 [archaeon]|nr:hypothetical protein [archaeon]
MKEMKNLNVSSSRAQMKIQEMAFVLVAIMIFFGLVVLLYMSIRLPSLRQDVNILAQNEASELAKGLSSTPEFAFTITDCSHCIDMDKVIALKSMNTYKDFWKLDYLKIEKVYPVQTGECTGTNYPNCQSITIIDNEEFGTPSSAFVALCRQAFENGEFYPKCELGRIYANIEVGQ